MSAPSPPGSPTNPPQATRNRTGTIIAVSGALVAVLSVATGIIGLVSASRSSAKVEVAEGNLSVASSAATSDARELEQAQATIALQSSAIASQNGQLEAQIAAQQSLSAQLATQPTITVTETAESSTENPPPAAGPLRHQGVISLGLGGETMDLNAPADDPKWGIGGGGGGTDTLTYRSSLYVSLAFSKSTNVLRLSSGETADYGTCSTQTGYVPVGGIVVDELLDRPVHCLHLNSGRWATLRLISRSGSLIELEITTWEAS